MEIRKPRQTESSILSDIALRSKAHWGYSEDFMQACREELSHNESDLLNPLFEYQVITSEDKVAGFYKLENLGSAVIELEALFVCPQQIGCGLGKRLLQHALQRAYSWGAENVEAHSDPHAEAFYIANGAVRVGLVPSGSIKDRYLPVIRFTLA